MKLLIMTVIVAAAVFSGSPAHGASAENELRLRTAMEQAQKQLTEMKEHMSMCGNMMNMMEKIAGNEWDDER